MGTIKTRAEFAQVIKMTRKTKKLIAAIKMNLGATITQTLYLWQTKP
jgi:hypothetical protein